MSNKINPQEIIDKLCNKYKETSWSDVLHDMFIKDNFKETITTLVNNLEKGVPFRPALKQIFQPFEVCDKKNMEVVFLNDKPFIGDGEADGLCFSGTGKEESTQAFMKATGNFDSRFQRLASQGVLMLNAGLTRGGDGLTSHGPLWKDFIEDLFIYLDVKYKGLIFVFFGKSTEHFAKFLGPDQYKFFIPTPKEDWDCLDVFNKVNKILIDSKRSPISWSCSGKI